MIEQLQNEIERLQKRLLIVENCYNILESDNEHLQTDRNNLALSLELIEKERDEARREVCRNEAIIRLQRHRVHRDSEDVVGLAKEIAVERGWDCFKENKENN